MLQGEAYRNSVSGAVHTARDADRFVCGVKHTDKYHLSGASPTCHECASGHRPAPVGFIPILELAKYLAAPRP